MNDQPDDNLKEIQKEKEDFSNMHDDKPLEAISQNTENQLGSDRQSHITQTLNEKLSLIPLNIRFIILGFIILFLITFTGFIIVRNSQKSNPRSGEITPTPTPAEETSTTPGAFFLPVDSPTSTQIPTITPTAKPTQVPATATPIQPTNTPAPTATHTPTPTPTHTPNPPIMNISYPQEGQYIEFTNPEQMLCVVDIPAGGNTTGIQRRHNQNDAGWTSYTNVFTLCFLPNEGSNRIQLQYKNQYGDESGVYTRQFNFHKAY